MKKAMPLTIENLNLGRLPSVPQVLLRLIEACYQVDVSFHALANIIRQDSALTARITAICNSPAYAQWNEDRDFDHLLVVLGLNNVKTIAVEAAVQQFFSQFNIQTGKSLGTLWYRSLWCAHTARSLASLTGYPFPDEAYLAGLLHRLGQLVFLSNQPEVYSELLLKSAGDADLAEQEREHFGAASHEVGALVVQEWELKSFVSDALLYQNEPAERLLDSPRLVRLINFTHKLAAPDTDRSLLHKEAELLFGLTPSVIDHLQKDIETQVQTSAEGLGIELNWDSAGQPDIQVETEDVRLELARRVRDFALLSGINLESENEQELQKFLNTVLIQLRILFGMNRTALFLADGENQHLQAVAAPAISQAQLLEFSIPIEAGRSRVAQALITGEIQTPLNPVEANPVPLIDQQLARALESDGLLCIPLVSESNRLGVIVAGCHESEFEQPDQQQAFLPLFAATVARTIDSRRASEQRTSELLDNTHQWHRRQARSIVHEINNPLGIINNYLHVLSVKFSDDPTISGQLKIVTEEIQRVGDIALRLRDIDDTQNASPHSVDINSVITDLVALFRDSFFQTHNITEHLDLDKKLSAIQTSRAALKQVITNLIKNAVEAMQTGGELWIRTHDHINIGGREYVELSIADSGPGIPAEIMAKLFTPVDSTKGSNHSGLGLTIVNNLISELKGSISCRGRSGGGTEFLIHLPRRLGDE